MASDPQISHFICLHTPRHALGVPPTSVTRLQGAAGLLTEEGRPGDPMLPAFCGPSAKPLPNQQHQLLLPLVGLFQVL